MKNTDSIPKMNSEFKLLDFVPRVHGQIDLKVMRPNSSKTKLELDERISIVAVYSFLNTYLR